MSKHTKGPWSIHQSQIIAERDSQGYTSIAKLNLTDETDEANAQLIAAAPELLEASKALLRFVSNEVGLTREQMHELSPLIATIKKAQGEE